MKLFASSLAVAALLVAGAAHAGNTPNTYNLTSTGGVRIMYQTTSMTGQPTLSYTVGHGPTHTFRGTQIQTSTTSMGTFVSVTLSVVPDLGSTVLSLYVPRVNLKAGAAAPTIHTFAFTTVHRTGFAPAAITGQIDVPTTVNLSGKASFNLF